MESEIIFSVLIAARDEEDKIEACLHSLMSQNFDKNLFEVYVGNDRSTDNTQKIVKEFRSKYSNIKLLNITENIENLEGKANVLAQLARVSTGIFFLITDADIITPPNWIESYHKSFTEGADLISGSVSVLSSSLFSELQNADWILYMANCHYSSEKGNPVTAIGCNMGIRKDVYFSIGGYENIPFSVTEDYELFKKVHSNDFVIKTLFNKKNLSYTYPLKNFQELLRQRKRWTTGSFKNNLKYLMKFNFNSLQLVLIILLGIYNIYLALLIYFLMWIKDLYEIKRAYSELSLKFKLSTSFYTSYKLLSNFLYFFNQFSSSTVEWKGRNYD